jgi:hypothetical protein
MRSLSRRSPRGLVDGTVLYTDSTHLKANANKNRYDTAVIAKSRADYWDALDEATEEDRQAHGRKPLPQKDRQPAEKETKVSRTDPEAGYMVREGKPKGFFYLDHRTVDGGWVSSQILTLPPPAFMTRSSIWAGSTASDSASTSMWVRSDSTPVTPPQPSRRVWNSAVFLASPAIAGQPRRGSA